MKTLALASLPREPRSIESTWLAYSPLVGLVWVQLSHDIVISIATLAAVLDPALTSQGRVIFWLQSFNTHIRESMRH